MNFLKKMAEAGVFDFNRRGGVVLLVSVIAGVVLYFNGFKISASIVAGVPAFVILIVSEFVGYPMKLH